jgi:hypothetical protein
MFHKGFLDASICGGLDQRGIFFIAPAEATWP